MINKHYEDQNYWLKRLDSVPLHRPIISTNYNPKVLSLEKDNGVLKLWVLV